MSEEKIYEYIDKLALKFNTTAEHVGEVVIKQAYISSIIGTLIGLLVICLGVVLLRVLYKEYVKYTDGEYSIFFERGYSSKSVDFSMSGILLVSLASLMVGIGAIFAPICLYDLVTVIINPDYVIVEEIKYLF